MSEEIKLKTYDEWLKYYENATKEDIIYDLTKDVEYFADAVKDIKNLQQELTKYKERCEKAIKYIKGAYEMACYSKSVSLEEENIEDLLEILEDKEKK